MGNVPQYFWGDPQSPTPTSLTFYHPYPILNPQLLIRDACLVLTEQKRDTKAKKVTSHIFCSAPNAPSQLAYASASRCVHRVGRSWGHELKLLLLTMVVMRMPMVARISWLGSPMQHKHSRLMNSLHQSGNLSKKALALFLSMRPLSERVASSFIVTVKEREREREKEKWQQ